MRKDRRIWSSAAVLGAVVVLFITLYAGPVHAAGEPEVYAGVESFTWKEFDDAGTRLLKEWGTRYAVGFAYAHEFPNHLTLKPRLELFGGDVAYDGTTTGGAVTLPVSTTTSYYGAKFELDLGGKIRPAKNFALEPFAGLGVRTWSRDIKDSLTTDGTTLFVVRGYTEYWNTFYGRLGLRGDVRTGQKSKVFFEAGVKLPISTENYINDNNVSYQEITLRPRNQRSYFAEAGIKLHVFKISAFYDSMRFKKSNVELVLDPVYGPFYIWQPKSTADIYGIRIGAAF